MDRKTEKLIHVIQSLSHTRTLAEIVDIVRTAARELVGSDGASFILKDGPYCYYVDEDAIGPLWKGQRFPLEACVSGWAMLHREKVLIPDIYQDARVPIEAYRPTFVKSMAMFPIRAQSPIGAIGTYWATLHTPTTEEVVLIQALADITSVSIENVNLYGDLQNRIKELNASNQAKDTLLNIVSHELKTPLTAIHGWATLMKSGTLNEKDQSIAVGTIYQAAQDQLRIVNDLLDSSQIVLKRLHLDRKALNFVEVVKKSIALEKTKIEEKKIDLDFEPAVPTLMVSGDEERLIQLTRNLISNAVKFSAKDGVVSLRLKAAGPCAELTVTDFGVGISDQMLPHLFEHFQQEDPSNTRVHGGLGLGLAIAQFLAEAHDGKITAKSEGKGRGATFIFTLPKLS
jgi:signal transduction histidine kinase